MTLSVLAVATCAVHTLPAVGEPHRFQVPAGEATDTLMEFGRQANQAVVYDYDRLRNRSTHAVTGNFEIGDALRLLLEGSGLDFAISARGTIFINVADNPSVQAVTAGQHASSPGPEKSTEKGLGKPKAATVYVNAQSVRETGLIQPEPSVESLDFSVRDLEHTAATDVGDFMRPVTFNFGGGATEGTQVFGREAQANPAFGTGFNLHSLGSRATLVLVNGHRLAPSGSAGAFYDVSNIPLSMIQEIQTLSGGGSTLWGEDAIGGVVNLVLRDDTSAPRTVASLSGLGGGTLGARLFSQSLSQQWDAGGVLLAGEYYERNPVFASQRRRATSDLTPWGGDNFGNPAGNPGTLVATPDNGIPQEWGIPTGQNGTSLTVSQLTSGPVLHDRFKDATILPQQRRISLVVAAHQQFANQWSLWANVLANRRDVRAQSSGVNATLTIPSTNPWYLSPTGSPIQVLYGFGADLGPQTFNGTVYSGQFTAGLNHLSAHNWKWVFYISYATEHQHDLLGNEVDFDALNAALADPNPSTAFNVFGDGTHTNAATIAAVRSQRFAHYTSGVTTLSWSASGPAVTLPAGNLTLTLGTDYRLQNFLSSTLEATQPSAPSNFQASRRMTAIYAQARVPILGETNADAHAVRLEVCAGAREERFSDVGNAFAPQLGLTFWPLPSVSIGATAAKLFRPPNLSDLSEAANISGIVVLADAQSPNTITNTLVWTGGNKSLRPESAQNLTGQLAFHPVSRPEAALIATYFRFTFSQIIEGFDLFSNVLNDPKYTWLITRSSSPAQRTEICQHSQFAGTPADCLQASVGALADIRLHNAATLKTDGIDLTGHLPLESAIGRLTASVEATYLLRYAQASTPTSAIASLLNQPHYPTAFRARATAGWEGHDRWMSLTMNFQGGYEDTDSIPHRPVSSWTTWDVSAGYQVPHRSFWNDANLQIQVRALNLFNTNPPFLNNTVEETSYDQENGNLLGRRVQIQLQVTW
jgi:outer membrane receptor protein involved in Fe transport